jgi:hypothetical protein
MLSALVHSSFSAFHRLTGRNCGTIAQAGVALSPKVAVDRANSVKTLDALLLAVSGGVFARKS